MKVSWIAGADDPEMRVVISRLQVAGEKVECATMGGERVNPENAYKADPVVESNAFIPIWIECRSRGTRKIDVGMIVDHHRQGDPGYSLSYHQFFEASSLGQVYRLLRLRATHTDLIIAAIDHCPRDAFAGKCPGVSGDEAREHRSAQLSVSVNLAQLEIRFMVKEFAKAIKLAPSIKIGGKEVVDLRFLELGNGYDVRYLCLQQSILENNVSNALFIHGSATSGHRKRAVVNGSANVVRAFIKTWAPLHGLVDIYGVPTRGYAGGYENQKNI